MLFFVGGWGGCDVLPRLLFNGFGALFSLDGRTLVVVVLFFLAGGRALTESPRSRATALTTSPEGIRTNRFASVLWSGTKRGHGVSQQALPGQRVVAVRLKARAAYTLHPLKHTM